MNPGAVITIVCWAVIVFFIVVGWIVDRHEDRDRRRRITRHLADETLERAWELPCAPDPRWRL